MTITNGQPPADLLGAAERARANAYAPYSKFLVGAALRDDRGLIHVGCNVENTAYPAGNCAETSAIAGMVAGGGRLINEIVLVGGFESPKHCSPCGGCRQRIREFANADTRIWLIGTDGDWKCVDIETLLPAGFSL